MTGGRTIPWDWYPGVIPVNVAMAEGSYVDSTHSFSKYRSEREVGVAMGRGSGIYAGTVLDVGPAGCVRIGAFACLNGARIVCDTEIEIGDYALVSWNVAIMDTWRLPHDSIARREELERAAARKSRVLDAGAESRPVRIGRNVWIGFGACLLPGVTVGEGSIIGAKTVIASDVPPYTVVAGDPVRVLRTLPREGQSHAG